MVFVTIIVTISKNCYKNNTKNSQIPLVQISQILRFYICSHYIRVCRIFLFLNCLSCRNDTLYPKYFSASSSRQETLSSQNHNTMIKTWKLTFIQCCHLIYRLNLDLIICSNYVLYSKRNSRWCIIIVVISLQSPEMWNNSWIFSAFHDIRILENYRQISYFVECLSTWICLFLSSWLSLDYTLLASVTTDVQLSSYCLPQEEHTTD